MRSVPARGDYGTEGVDVATAHEDVEGEWSPAEVTGCESAGGGFKGLGVGDKTGFVAAPAREFVEVKGLVGYIECVRKVQREIVNPAEFNLLDGGDQE